MYKCYRLPENLNKIIDAIANDLLHGSLESKLIQLSYQINGWIGKNDANEKAKKLIAYYKENIIDANETSKINFPIEKVDIFISHAHKDKELAYKLSSLLEALDLKCFIDSSVWENVNDLIKELDQEYSYNSKTGDYDYDIRNIITAHAHLMLSSALVEMINRCECFFFIDTENSTYNENSNNLDAMTFSPWIKLEIDTARIITRRQPERLRKLYESKNYSVAACAAVIPQFLYPLSMRHLKKLEANSFTYWIKRSVASKGVNHPLTELYVHGE